MKYEKEWRGMEINYGVEWFERGGFEKFEDVVWV